MVINPHTGTSCHAGGAGKEAELRRTALLKVTRWLMAESGTEPGLRGATAGPFPLQPE